MRSITNKIAVMLIMALFVSFAAISAVSYYTAEKKVVQLVSQNQDQILKDIKSVSDSFLGNYVEAVKKLAKHVESAPDYDESILKAVVMEKEQSSSITGDVYYSREEDGHHFQSNNIITTPEADGYDPRTRGWYTEAKRVGDVIYTEPYVDAMSKNLVMTFAKPITKNGKFTGVAGIDVKIDALNGKILDMGKTENGYVYIINKDGVMLIDSDIEYISKAYDITKIIAKKITDKDFDENGLIPYVNSSGDNVTAKFLRINDKDWTAIAVINADTFSNHTMPLLKAQLVLAVLFIAALSIFVYILLKKSLSPIKTIQEKLEDTFKFVTYEESKAPQKLVVTTQDEFGMMSRSINENIDKVVNGIKKDSALIDEMNGIANLMIKGHMGATIKADPNNPALVQLKDLLNRFFSLLL